MGILYNKERIIDFIITQEGKRQAGSGELRVKFASFTDHHTYYEKSGSLDLPDLAEDASNRIFFEAASRYQDVIVPELEAGMSLRPFRTADFQVMGNSIASGTFQKGFIDRINVVSGPALSNTFSQILDGIEKNFTDQKIISSIDEYSYSNNFSIMPSNINFKEGGNKYLKSSGNSSKINLEDVSSIFHDRRFNQFPNFKYLPPQNLPFPGQVTGSVLANYPKLDEESIGDSFSDLLKNLQGCEKNVINFSETSRNNNFLCQIFESSNSGVDKLSIIEFGTFESDDPTDKNSKRVVFVGKIRRDASGAETFLCLFTLVLE
jgi:hypothetical protein